MQKFGRKISQECRESIIYDEVVLGDVHEAFVHFCQTMRSWLSTARGRWSIAARNRGYTQKL